MNEKKLPIERNNKPKSFLIKDEDPLELDVGIFPEKRSVEELLVKGIVNIDKPKNPTSHQVSAWVRDMLGIGRAGHCGTLDPQVTGVLPVALGKATRLVDVLMGAGKEYVGVINIHKPVDREKIQKIRGDFTGDIYQFPPLKSAVKRQLRVREIYYLDLLEMEGRDILVKVGCEGGTYIRTLAVDMGDALGVGAHLKELRRTKAAFFNENDSVRLQELKDAWVAYEEDGNEGEIRNLVLPMECMVGGVPHAVLKDTAVDAVCHGADAGINGIVKLERGILAGDLVALMTRKNEVVALGEATLSTDAIMMANRGIGFRTTRVLMERHYYPAMWKRPKKNP